MDNRSHLTAADIGFFRNTGLALVFLTVMAGSISLIGSLALFPSDNSAINSYGIETAGPPEIMAPAE